MKVTGDEVKAAMIAANIERVDHHGCGMCGYMTNYQRRDDDLYFDPGCYCARRGMAGLERRAWSDVAEWINRQNEEWATKIALRFGLKAPSQTSGR